MFPCLFFIDWNIIFAYFYYLCTSQHNCASDCFHKYLGFRQFHLVGVGLLYTLNSTAQYCLICWLLCTGRHVRIYCLLLTYVNISVCQLYGIFQFSNILWAFLDCDISYFNKLWPHKTYLTQSCHYSLKIRNIIKTKS